MTTTALWSCWATRTIEEAPIKHFDFFGRQLAVGDRVAFLDTKYKELHHGEILKLSEKQATLRNLDYTGSHSDAMGYGRTVRSYGAIVKAPDRDSAVLGGGD